MKQESYADVLAEHRHLHTHMGMVMGFLVAEKEPWPTVLGLEGRLPEGRSGI